MTERNHSVGDELVHTDDTGPGIRRERHGESFRFRDPAGHLIKDASEIARINSLAIPPAYDDVWICPEPRGHLQATGRDVRGRKQYRYHPLWRATRDESKFERTIAFGHALPKIRKRVTEDIARPGLPKVKVLATIVELLESTLIRVGNDEYARENNSFGLTTMRTRHIKVAGEQVRFSFRGKSGVQHAISLRDRKIAAIIKRLRDLPGQELFHFVDDAGAIHRIGSSDVNAYLREIMQNDFTAKDFRTWAGTVACALALADVASVEAVTQRKHHVKEVVTKVATRLGNTPAVCRKCYVHPSVIDSFLEKGRIELVRKRAEKVEPSHATTLRPEEKAVLRFLETNCNGASIIVTAV